jgi:hypothetical protein
VQGLRELSVEWLDLLGIHDFKSGFGCEISADFLGP